jgi:Tol biopolymer transport system component
MPLSPGARLGPYEIVSPLGAGGMGEVYVARDARLNRTVAIKILPSEFTADAGRRGRFEREAKVIASLSHPHICTVHDVGDHEGVAFLVMERLEGETLAERLTRGALPLSDAILCARQVAEGLECAHGAGIVHRDLKPANVMLTKAGAKLLDFGLAKPGLVGQPGRDETRTAPLTMQGTILGTLPYMAPEQLEGKPVDARADIFAFGAMVHEMVTGRRAFPESSEAGLIGAILHSHPPALGAMKPGTPRALERLVAICLAKDPGQRWSSAHDLRLQLEGLADSSSAEAAAAPAPRRSRARLAWIAALIATVIALGAATLVMTRRASPDAAALDLLSIVPPRNTTFVRGEAPQISPDGRHVAFVATDAAGTRGLYVRSRDSASAPLLPGTENATQPFWSPDSRMLGFFADGKVKTISTAGGAPIEIARASLPRGAAWSRGNLILFSQQPNTPLVYVPASGGEPTAVPGLPISGIPGFPAFLPDGRHYLFTALSRDTRLADTLMLGSLDSPETRRVVATTSSGSYASGHVFFRRNTTLMAQPFDAVTFELSGSPVAIAENVGYHPVTYQALFSVSDTGTIAYRDASPGAELVWFDRSGKRLSNAAPPAEYNSLCMTLDGKRIVYELADLATGSIDLWTLDVTTSVTTQLTFAGSVEFYPVCSPSGTEMVFAALKPTSPNLFRQSILAPGEATLVLETPAPKIPTDWSRDGRVLIYATLNRKTGFDIESFPFGGQPRVLVATPAEEHSGKLSPDGRWLAYTSNENGRSEIYVQPMPPSGSKWLISRGGGENPQWSADGRQLYFIAPDRKLMTMAVRTEGTTLMPVPATVLMDTLITAWEAGAASYAVAPDGQRFLISSATDAAPSITLLLNWTAALKR